MNMNAQPQASTCSEDVEQLFGEKKKNGRTKLIEKYGRVRGQPRDNALEHTYRCRL